MRKSWFTLAVLLAGVIALASFVWLKPPKPQSVTYAVSTLKVTDARKLRVQRKGKTFALLEKRGGEWFLLEPIAAPADAFQVLRLLSVLEAKSATQYSSSAAHALANFELESPQTEIVINDQRFAFGAINTVTREQYVLAQMQIFPLDPHYAAAVPANANALLRRSVLAPTDTPVRFEFGEFNVANDGRKWSTTPQAGDTSQDDYNHWVAQWREGSALRSEISDERKAEREILVTLKDGTKITLGVMQSEPELIVRRADLGLQFLFAGDIGKWMIAPPLARK